MTPNDFLAKIGPLASEDMRKTGVLASITIAQAILESRWGDSGLTKQANNLFGMKANLGTNWGSEWKGGVYSANTKEQTTTGKEFTVSANFRAYDNWLESITDHSKYLLGSTKAGNPRYVGIDTERDYRKVAEIIKAGGYATDVTYVDKLCSLVTKYNLTQYDVHYEKGWHSDEKGWWYADTDRSYLRSTWKIINHHWYYFGEDGYMLTGWQTIDGFKYYLEESDEGKLQGAMYVSDSSGAQGPAYVNEQ
ncbi:MAG: glucosaminidase domain-containing protein [Lachnospiraceae bacterium]|nr:glucosaminidase domain-containing protein [Lachnospiraceae bacterium]